MALREAIGRVLRARDVENVFDEVCRTIVESGFLAAGAGTDDDLRIRAGVGTIPKELVERARTSGRRAIQSTAAIIPLRDGDRSIGALVVLAKDEAAFDGATIDVLVDLAAVVVSAITNHWLRAAEAELSEREQAYRSLAENTPDLITRWDRSLRRLYVNRAFAEMLERTSEQLVGTRLGEDYSGDFKRIVGASVQNMKRAIDDVFASGEPAFLEMPVPNERGIGVAHLTFVPERDATGTVRSVLGIGRDVTAIRESERDARTLSDSSPDFISRLDSKGHFRFVNKAVLDVLDQPVESLIGRHFRDVFSGPYLEQVATILDDAIDGGQPVETEIELPLKGRLRAFNIRVHPERDYEGKFASALVVSRDITEHRALEQQLRQSQKMEAVGQLAGGIAHDFNNMLAAILMQAGLASRPHATPTAIREALRAITDTTERAARLTQQLLTFSRREPTNPVLTDLSELVSSAAHLLRRVLGEHIVIHVRVRGGVRPFARVDPVMIEQVLMNLGINARDAMPGGGTLVIALEIVEISSVELHQHPGGRVGTYVCITVTDTGVGIDASDLPHIFEPFFTTKEVGRGTGLGLATVFGIVQQHDGWVEVDSMLRQGTTFRIYVPAQDAVATAPRETPRTTAPPRGGTETVLLVEDEDAVRSAVRQVLEEYGYRVVEAESAAVALKRFGAGEHHVDLLLTDVIMPGGVSGMQLADRMLEKQPGLRVILMSGYSADATDRTILRKPFTPEDLVAAVRASIERR